MFNSSTKWVFKKTTYQRFALAMAILLSVPAAFAASPSGNDGNNPDGNENPGSMFSVNGYSFEGEFLVITYSVQYPGMTKVKLFDDGQKLLWRSQYVNDKEGKHKLILRRKYLTGGNYTFEFDFKNQKEEYTISL
ncbi:MAG: hypothetical protein AAF570_21770 [Bacteroidota bacterium]